MIESALLAGICSHPHDDTPRFIYADWLEDHDRIEEAEFIRTQCRLAAHGPEDPDYCELLLRENELKIWLTSHRTGPEIKLRGGFAIESGANWWLRSRRGFPRTIEVIGARRERGLSVAKTAAAIQKLFARFPIRWLILNQYLPGQLANLLRQPVMERLERLTISTSEATIEEIDEIGMLLANAPTLTNIRGLYLGLPLGDSALEALAHAEFQGMETLYLDPGRLTGAGLNSLSRAKWFQQLHELILDQGLDEDAFVQFLHGGPYSRLHTLSLRGNFLGLPAWEQFARTKTVPKLVSLNLHGTDLSHGRMAVLARAKGFALVELDVRKCGIGNDGCQALGRASWTSSLQILKLSDNRIGPTGVESIARSSRLANLRWLELLRNPIREHGLNLISKGKHLRQLKSLSVGGLKNLIGLEFVSRLNMPQLRSMNLEQISLGPSGAKVIASDPRFSPLTRLRLAGCDLGDEGAEAVITSPNLHHLVELDLSNNGITNGVISLADRRVLPQLGVCRLHQNPVNPEIAKKLSRLLGPGYDDGPPSFEV